MLTLTSPIETWAHSCRAGRKLAALCGFTLILFALSSPLWLGLCALLTVAVISSAGKRFGLESVRMLRPLLPFVALIALWHLITRDALGVTIILRMITAVAAANFVTMTTRLSEMITVFQRLAKPLSPLIAPKALALAIALTLRFIPTMLARSQTIRESWQARAPRPPRWRILLPSTLAALDDADHVAEALRARGGTE